MNYINILILDESEIEINILSGLIETNQSMTVDFVLSEDKMLESLNKKKYQVILLNINIDIDFNINNILNKYPVILYGPAKRYEDPLVKKLIISGAQDFFNISTVTMQSINQCILMSLDRWKYVDKLHDLVFIDDLTKLYNTRGFQFLFNNQLKIIDRNNIECSLVFIDIDKLKQINDTHGHIVGDQAIKYVALALKETLRSTDIISRRSGDEFICLAIDISINDTFIMFNRFKDRLDLFNKQQNKYKLSVSIGIVSYNVNAYMNLEELQDIACKKMYKQKNRARIE